MSRPPFKQKCNFDLLQLANPSAIIAHFKAATPLYGVAKYKVALAASLVVLIVAVEPVKSA